VLRRSEREDGWLASAALGAGLLTLAVKLSGAAPMLAALWRVDELDATTARTLVDITGFAFTMSWATTGALVLGFLLCTLWLAAASVTLLRRPPKRAAAASPLAAAVA
jgi:hypothetical protein